MLQANSGDPDQTPRSVASGLGLHLLPSSHKKDARLIWVKILPVCTQRCYGLHNASIVSALVVYLIYNMVLYPSQARRHMMIEIQRENYSESVNILKLEIHKYFEI